MDHFSYSAGFSKGFLVPLESCLKQALVRGGVGTESSQDCAPNPTYPVPSPVMHSVHWALSSRQMFKFLVLQMKKPRLNELELSPTLPVYQGCWV